MKSTAESVIPAVSRVSNPSLDQLWNHFFATKEDSSREALLVHYSPLVRQVIGRMKIRFIQSLDRDDLESMGSVGLIKALDRFNPAAGVKFETYAYRWIQGHVIDYVRSLDSLSRTSRERLSQFKESYRRLRDTLGHDPAEAEILQELSLSRDQLATLYEDMGYCETLSLQGRRGEDGDVEDGWEDILEDHAEKSPLASLEKKELLESLKRVLSELPENDRVIISLYHYEGLTLKEIGELLGLSESRVCQMHSKAIWAIRNALSIGV